MVIVFSVLLIISLFSPILLWWIRNISRVILKTDIEFITDNLGKIFILGFVFAIIFGVFLGLAVSKII